MASSAARPCHRVTDTDRRRAQRACTPERDWGNDLSAGPAGLIGERVLSHGVADYVRFRAVCAAWRASSPDPRAHDVLDRRFHPRRWIMIPSTASSNDHNRRAFVNVSTGECIHVRLPDLRHCHYLLGSTDEGLIVLCRKDTLAVQLHNPLTGQQANLPCATTLLSPPTNASIGCEINDDFRVRNACLAGDSTVVLRYGYSAIAVARPGDECWTQLGPVGNFKSAMSFAGRFYCVTFRNILVLETTPGTNQPPRLAVAVDFKRRCRGSDLVHLVDVDGELILVHCALHPSSTSFCGRRYTAYRVNLDRRSMVPMFGLGTNAALFMGMHRSLSFRPMVVSQSIDANTVYVCYKSYNYDKTGRSKIVAIDCFGRRCFEPNFSREHVASYLSRYVCS